MFTFLLDNLDQFLEQLLEHIGLTFLSLLLAVLVAVPLGVLATRRRRLAGPVLGIAGVLQTVPSIALLGFLIPFLGIGLKPAILALFLYALLPILRNTYTGISGVDAAVTEAARGMGMTEGQLLWRVQLPLAMPVLLAGIRTATVINVGVATLAAYIGAGGLGEFIFGGIALNNNRMILAGAVPAALLALAFDQGIGLLERRGRKSRRGNAGLLALLPVLAALYWLPRTVAPGLATAFEPEYMGRQDGYDYFSGVYDEVPFRPVILNSALMYEALRSGSVDAACGYSTDGRVQAYDLRVLEDDRHAFPPYYCAPVFNGESYRRYPEAAAALNRLQGLLTDSVMTSLNYRVDYEQVAPERVAREFLQQQGLWQPDRRRGGPVFRVGSKIFTEQYILTELFAQLINGYTDLDVETIPGLGGSKICFDALLAGEIDCYPEYTGTAFLVLLSPPDSVVATRFGDRDAVYAYVKETSHERFDLAWLPPLGFNNTYAILVREQDAGVNGWSRISDLQPAAE